MERRELLALMGVGAAGLWMGVPVEAADDEHASIDHEHIKKIGECAIVCNMLAHHCLEHLKKEGDTHRELHAKVLQMAGDCQEFCVQAATMMARSSPLAVHAHKACAEACRACAEACEQGHGDMMKKCAEACRACEQACVKCCKEA